jgi:hypothetical protein
MGPCLKLSVKLQRLDEAAKTTPNFAEDEDSPSGKSLETLLYEIDDSVDQSSARKN